VVDKYREKGGRIMNSVMTKLVDNEEFLILDSEFLGEQVEIKLVIESVNKERAQQLLAYQYEKQRKLSEALIDKLVQALNNYEYIEAMLNPIHISDTGKLMDGQHRLTALTRTGRTVQLLMAYGIPEKSFAYFDQDRPRSLRDALQTNSIPNADKVAPAAKLLYQLITGKANTPRNEVAIRLVGDYPDFQRAVAFAESMTDDTHIITSVGSVLYFLYQTHHPEECKLFFDILRLGDREIFGRPRHPISALSKKLKQEWLRTSRARRDQDMNNLDTRHLGMSWVHQAFMAYVAGRGTLTWEPISNTPNIISDIRALAKATIKLRHNYAETV